MSAHMLTCTACQLHETRKNVVLGVGDPRARLMLIGEAPGQHEDELGLPFVGQAGRLLTQVLAQVGLAREAVFITNVVKCRPPANRRPERDELRACRGFLLEEWSSLRPLVVVTLGETATQALLHRVEGISALRDQIFRWKSSLVIPTYHPAYALRQRRAREDIVRDLEQAMKLLRG